MLAASELKLVGGCYLPRSLF